MSVPPNSTRPPPAGSSLIAWTRRPGGLALGCCSVHVVPSHVHVSSNGGPKKFHPPKSTIRWWVESYAIPASHRAGGEAGGFACFQSVPFHSHVSPNALTPLDPPNRTNWCREGSYAMPDPPRTDGRWGGNGWLHVGIASARGAAAKAGVAGAIRMASNRIGAVRRMTNPLRGRTCLGPYAFQDRGGVG